MGLTIDDDENQARLDQDMARQIVRSLPNAKTKTTNPPPPPTHNPHHLYLHSPTPPSPPLPSQPPRKINCLHRVQLRRSGQNRRPRRAHPRPFRKHLSCPNTTKTRYYIRRGGERLRRTGVDGKVGGGSDDCYGG